MNVLVLKDVLKDLDDLERYFPCLCMGVKCGNNSQVRDKIAKTKMQKCQNIKAKGITLIAKAKGGKEESAETKAEIQSFII